MDWIFRDVARVRRSWDDAQAGHVTWQFQVGHPLGFPNVGYAAELALAVVLADPSGGLTELRAEIAPEYPRHWPMRSSPVSARRDSC